jgi:uncharacterized FAD-dependent dehydrogenase
VAQGQLNPESNVQFGEGGAGTFSDGKLYSQIKDPAWRGRKVLTEFVKAGAPAEILYVSKPHIGTFKLVTMVENHARRNRGAGRRDPLRRARRGHRYRQRTGARPAPGRWRNHRRHHVVLAVGHSARDTFQMLHARGVHIEAKPFSIGVRIEHPQSLIDRARFGSFAGHPLLGAADYKLVHHCGNGRSAYSFCMCPGGTVVAATSEPGRVVTNGMSQYSRNERNANAAIVVGVTPADFPGDETDPLAGIEFQRHWESLAFEPAAATTRPRRNASATFLAGRPSTRLGSGAAFLYARRAPDRPARPACPITWSPRCANRCRPSAARSAASTWTTRCSPASRRAPRRRCASRAARTSRASTRAACIPAGEGAGYAGGILSAAVDGIKVAEAVALSLIASQRS